MKVLKNNEDTIVVFGPKFLGAIQAVLLSAVLIAGVIGYTFLPVLESKYFPIINKESVKLSYNGISEDTGLVKVDFVFEKLRECRPILEEFAWYYMSEEGWKRVHFTIPEDPGNTDRPKGPNFSPNWEVNLLTKENFNSSQKIIFNHSCNPLWNIETEIDIPPLKDRI